MGRCGLDGFITYFVTETYFHDWIRTPEYDWANEIRAVGHAIFGTVRISYIFTKIAYTVGILESVGFGFASQMSPLAYRGSISVRVCSKESILIKCLCEESDIWCFILQETKQGRITETYIYIFFCFVFVLIFFFFFKSLLYCIGKWFVWWCHPTQSPPPPLLSKALTSTVGEIAW